MRALRRPDLRCERVWQTASTRSRMSARPILAASTPCLASHAEGGSYGSATMDCCNSYRAHNTSLLRIGHLRTIRVKLSAICGAIPAAYDEKCARYDYDVNGEIIVNELVTGIMNLTRSQMAHRSGIWISQRSSRYDTGPNQLQTPSVPMPATPKHRAPL